MSVCCDPGGGKMAATALQSSSEKDVDCLEKLIKVFASKSAQVIVQARLGSPIETKCNPDSTQTDWVSHLSCVEVMLISMKATFVS